ncbi:thioredoxin family protein [Xanthomonas sp. 60]
MCEEEPDAHEVTGLTGWTLLDFGTAWCGHCQRAAPLVTRFVASHPMCHVGVEDGRGRPLGRAYRVKLWPTLVLLKDGIEQARVVRPQVDADLAPLAAAMGAQRH